MPTPDLIPILFAVLTASLVGSAHCVGMCGPFALMVLGNEKQQLRKTRCLSLYHVGRAMTYALIGTAAGLTGSLIDNSAAVLGWQQTAATITGVGMIAFGLLALVRLSRFGSVHFAAPGFLQTWIRSGFRKANRLPVGFRPLSIGLITGFLPCGWLYAFVLLAIGTASGITGAAVMLAFWVGTVPALSIVSLGAARLSQAWKDAIPFCTAVLMIVAGILTVGVRAHADLSGMAANSSWSNESEVSDIIEAASIVGEQALPCCQGPTSDSGPTQATSDDVASETSETPSCCQNPSQ